MLAEPSVTTPVQGASQPLTASPQPSPLVTPLATAHAALVAPALAVRPPALNAAPPPASANPLMGLWDASLKPSPTSSPSAAAGAGHSPLRRMLSSASNHSSSSSAGSTATAEDVVLGGEPFLSAVPLGAQVAVRPLDEGPSVVGRVGEHMLEEVYQPEGEWLLWLSVGCNVACTG